MFLPSIFLGVVSSVRSQNGGFTSGGNNNEGSTAGDNNLSNVFNISNRDTELNILSSSPTNGTNSINIAFGIDTQDLYIWNGSVWNKYLNDA